MTKDQVIELAKQAGINAQPGWPSTAFLERFALRVRNSTLDEAVQKVIELDDGEAPAYADCRDEIRAMKETI
jgi:hypothetical protein